jgi:hypothetical protein
MHDVFESIDAQAAQAFLRTFSAEAQRQGHARFHEGAVEGLQQENNGKSYSAIVQEAAWKNEVSLSHDPIDGWGGNCSCPVGVRCAHLFAAMSALLAEHRMAVVRKLSAGRAGSETILAKLKPRLEPEREEKLAERLTGTTGQALSREELRFLHQLHNLYLRCRQTRQITYWDLQQLGFPVRPYDWGELNIWPALPKTEQEFWLYLVNYLSEQNLKVPEFMLPVSDLTPITERLTQWRRATEIEKWKQAIGSLQSRHLKPTLLGEIELRLVIDGTDARLHWQRPCQTGYEPLKQQQYRRLEADYDKGQANFNAESQVLWQLFTSAVDYGLKMELDALDDSQINTLGRILRIRALENRIVDAKGDPLERVAQPLRWEMVSAKNEAEDYCFRLVQADGAPAPEIRCVVPGNPALYLTPDCIFAGPDSMGEILNPTTEIRIPAPAVESNQGVVFLQSLGLELPPALRERVRFVPYQVTITCQLRPTYAGSGTEECAVAVLAEASDGRQMSWTGSDWVETRSTSDGKKGRKDNATITVYDTAALKELPAVLEPLNLKRTHSSDALVLRVGKTFADSFVVWLKSVPPRIRVVLEGELASLAGGEVAGRVKLEVTEQEIDWFDLRVVLDVDDMTLSPQEIKLLLNAKGGYVRLRGKGWRRLRYDLGEEENDRLARLGLSPNELSAEPQRLHALQLADEAAKQFLPAAQVEQIQRRASEIKARVEPKLPAAITAQLRPYQLAGFHFLAYLAINRFGGILADDMGLGKTLQTLAWLVWLREQQNGRPIEQAGHQGPKTRSAVGPSLVICPKSVMDNWQAEAARFAPGLCVKVWSASELQELPAQLSQSDVHVLNYSQLRSLDQRLVSVQWLVVVLDEGQYIKNPNSQTAQISRGLRAQYRLVLSGTPIENRLVDLWSLMAFTMPGILGNRAQFARLYDVKGDALARRRLAARVRPFLLRRTKAQVAQDLPDRIEEDLFCEIEGEQKVLYRAELKAAQQLLLKIKTQKELAQQQFHFLTSLLRLRQICCHPRLIQPNSPAPSAKSEALIEQLEPLVEEGQKVLVFSQFVQMLDLLHPLLAERKWPTFYLVGQTENRGELVREFQETEGPAIFLISLKAGGFGLNLTAASYVVLFDPWWNPAVENQAIDRTHRIGQNSKVIAYRLLIKNSIEEKIRELQKQKKALADDVFGEEKFAQSLTLEDLRFLFAD